jgi:hypothetical protein
MGKTVEGVLGLEIADKLRGELGRIVDRVSVYEEGLWGTKVIKVELCIEIGKPLTDIYDNDRMLERVLKDELLELRDALMRMLYSGDHGLGINFNRHMRKDKIELNHATYAKLMKADSELVGRLENLLTT